MPPKTNYIILINYNNYEDTLDCLASINEQTYPNCVPIVVDNASANESVGVIKDKFPNCKIIESRENLGFSGANNLGAERAIAEGADYITFLNNDTVLSPVFFEVILSGIEDDQCICPLMLYYDNPNLINYAGGIFDMKKGAGTNPYRGKELNDREFHREKVTLAHGCCCIMTTNTYRKLGPWKNEYFLYREDDEYSARMRVKGISIIFEPGAVLYHKESASTGGDEGQEYRNYYLTRNRLYNIKCYRLGKLVELRAVMNALLGYSRYILFRDRRFKNCLLGVMDYYRGVVGKREL